MLKLVDAMFPIETRAAVPIDDLASREPAHGDGDSFDPDWARLRFRTG
jgi:hypothetical protein